MAFVALLLARSEVRVLGVASHIRHVATLRPTAVRPGPTSGNGRIVDGALANLSTTPVALEARRAAVAHTRILRIALGAQGLAALRYQAVLAVDGTFRLATHVLVLAAPLSLVLIPAATLAGAIVWLLVQEDKALHLATCGERSGTLRTFLSELVGVAIDATALAWKSAAVLIDPAILRTSALLREAARADVGDPRCPATCSQSSVRSTLLRSHEGRTTRAAAQSNKGATISIGTAILQTSQVVAVAFVAETVGTDQGRGVELACHAGWPRGRCGCCCGRHLCSCDCNTGDGGGGSAISSPLPGVSGGRKGHYSCDGSDDHKEA
mmetsp:Transcript_60087/g.173272  ORF Transcript_60087/g.173272 Transcript_60087/m.173272 type:complete len:324 (+) Transcript_60087:885-1856(+)